MSNDKCTVTSVAIKDEYLDSMTNLKSQCGLTKKYIINAALKEFLEKYEDTFIKW